MKNGKRTALVTGAARGIGRGISLTLAEHGYTVCAVGTKPGKAVAEYTDALRELSPDSFYVQGDISSHEDRIRIAEEAFRGLGELDVLVNNAGVAPTVRADLLDMTEESFDRVLGINLRGAFFLTQEVARRMAFAYPDFARNLCEKDALDPKKVCVTCSKCTAIMRKMHATGCPIRDREVYLPMMREALGGE